MLIFETGHIFVFIKKLKKERVRLSPNGDELDCEGKFIYISREENKVHVKLVYAQGIRVGSVTAA